MRKKQEKNNCGKSRRNRGTVRVEPALPLKVKLIAPLKVNNSSNNWLKFSLSFGISNQTAEQSPSKLQPTPDRSERWKRKSEQRGLVNSNNNRRISDFFFGWSSVKVKMRREKERNKTHRNWIKKFAYSIRFSLERKRSHARTHARTHTLKFARAHTSRTHVKCWLNAIIALL